MGTKRQMNDTSNAQGSSAGSATEGLANAACAPKTQTMTIVAFIVSVMRVTFGPPPLPECRSQVAGHGRQLRTPCTPVVLTAGREVEVPVAAAGSAVVRVESTVAALSLVAVSDHRRGVAARQCLRAEDPQP